jgi:hypothetical protein
MVSILVQWQKCMAVSLFLSCQGSKALGAGRLNEKGVESAE